MYQLNHKLTEQKNMMTAITENTIASDKSQLHSLSYFSHISLMCLTIRLVLTRNAMFYLHLM